MEPQCPRCGKDLVRRSHREGTIEKLLSLFYVYPFRCQLCMYRFRASQWGVRYDRQPIDQRQYERIPVRIPASFSWDQGTGLGIITELSMAGCTLDTDTKPLVGALFRISVQPSEPDPAVMIEAAVVRSVRGPGLGLEFLRIQPSEQERLRQFMFRRLVERRV